MSYLKSLLMAALVVSVSACAVCEKRPAPAKGDMGACVENQRHELEKGLSKQISAKEVTVAQAKGGALKIGLSADNNFDTGISKVKPEAAELFDKISKELAKCDRTVVHVIGHTDSVGKPENNQKLSERRANAVAAILAAHGVKHIKKEGRGEREPIASNDTVEGKRENRRVEILVSP